MKLKELLKDIPVLERTAPEELNIKEVRYNSAQVQPGDLFVAVPGYATDGHRYIADAVARGAAAVLCEREMPPQTPWIRVDSARAALAQLGANYYGHPSASMVMIGVTGTNGKTSVTYLLKELLERALGAKVGLIGTICNMIGDRSLPTERTTPESFALQGLLAQMAQEGCTHVVMEVSSHALALHRVKEIDFAVGAFTNLTEDHLDFHGSMEEYAKAKAMLFQACRKGVFHGEDPWCGTMVKHARCSIYTVGQEGKWDLRGENVRLKANGIEMDVLEEGNSAHLQLGIPGRFTVSNALTVLAIARNLGIELEAAVEALSCARGVKGRIEVVPTPGKEFTVLIDYAHTPDGLKNVLRSVRDFAPGRVLVLFGCGGDRDRQKRPLMGAIAAKYADLAMVTSDNPRTEAPMEIIQQILAGMEDAKVPVFVEENRRLAIRKVLALGQKDDVIVLAGKGHETYQILGTQKVHLDEREEVAAALWEQTQSH